MVGLVGFAVFGLILGFVLWVPLCAGGVAGVGVVVYRRCRRRLRAAGRPTGTASIVMGLLLFGVVPAAGIAVGCTVAVERTVAEVIEEGGQRLVDWVFDRAEPLLVGALGIPDGEKLIAVKDLRARLGEQRRAITDAHPGRLDIKQRARAASVDALDTSLAAIGLLKPSVSWSELRRLTRAVLASRVQSLFADVAEGFRSHARLLLILLALGSAILDGAIAMVIRWMCRAPPKTTPAF